MPSFDLTIDGVVEHIRQLPYNEIVKIAYVICEAIDGNQNYIKNEQERKIKNDSK